MGGAYLAKHGPSQADLAQMGRELVELLLVAKMAPQLNEYAFADYAKAFAALQSSAQAGKIILKIN